MRRKLRQSAFERLVVSLVQVSGRMATPCWVWTKAVCNKGYGQFKCGENNKRVHIAAWEMANGRKVRKGYTLDHLCRDKKCWRPTHVEEVTRALNTARGNRANPRSTVKATAASSAARRARAEGI